MKFAYSKKLSHTTKAKEKVLLIISIDDLHVLISSEKINFSGDLRESPTTTHFLSQALITCRKSFITRRCKNIGIWVRQDVVTGEKALHNWRCRQFNNSPGVRMCVVQTCVQHWRLFVKINTVTPLASAAKLAQKWLWKNYSPIQFRLYLKVKSGIFVYSWSTSRTNKIFIVLR